MAEETTFYSDQSGVRVTDKRVIIGNTTYSLANITSVSTKVENPNLGWPILVIVIGILLLVSGFGGRSASERIVLLGVLVTGFGYFWYRGSKPRWHLRIASASGESTPLSSTNQQWITGIARAINEAIIHRT